MTTYCERWDRVRHRPVLPFTDAEARDRFERGPWFTVVVPYRHAPGAPARPADVADAPEAVLELETGLTTVTVEFFDDDTGAEFAEYVYRRTGDHLRFDHGTARVAPEDAGWRLSTVQQVQQLVLHADGACDVLVDDRARDVVQVGETVLDVAAHTEPVPEFGDWAGLARYDR